MHVVAEAAAECLSLVIQLDQITGFLLESDPTIVQRCPRREHERLRIARLHFNTLRLLVELLLLRNPALSRAVTRDHVVDERCLGGAGFEVEVV